MLREHREDGRNAVVRLGHVKAGEQTHESPHARGVECGYTGIPYTHIRLLLLAVEPRQLQHVVEYRQHCLARMHHIFLSNCQ